MQLCTHFVPLQLSTVVSIEFEQTWFESKLSLRIEAGTKLPLNMLKGSVLTDNTASAHEANEAEENCGSHPSWESQDYFKERQQYVDFRG